jgi:uncharacterized protein (TIGR03437 family)
VGLKPIRLSFPILATLISASVLTAAPALRLTSAAVGPVTVAAGSNGTAQTVEAYNAGDGSLSLTTSSKASWLKPIMGSPRNCTRRTGSCIPITINFNTASLAAGFYTGTLTVSDPNAVDAPQTITVTVQVGGGVPARLDIYTPPGGSGETTFYTNSLLTTRAATNDQRNWLGVAMALDGAGSFQFVYPYRVKVTPLETQTTGSYDGTITTSGSNFPGDNKTVPVTMRVTTQPIIKLTDDVRPVSSVTARGILVTLAEGGPRYDLSLLLTNAGQGSLAVSGATATGGDWLSVATAAPAYVTTLIDPSKLTAGSYTGAVTVNSNAANGALTLPVALTVVAKSAPVVRFQGVVDNAIFEPGGSVCPGDILAVVGDQLSYAPVTLGKAPPLATLVGGARVLVNGQAAPMYYSTYGQLAFQLPYETAVGTATIQVERDGQVSNKVTVDVVGRAPRLLKIGVGEFGAIVNANDGSLPLPSSNTIPGWVTKPARRGDTLTIYAIGLGQTSPAAVTGEAAPTSPLARLILTPTVIFGGGPTGVRATPAFAGLTPTSSGLYQINVQIPNEAARGVIALQVGFNDALSNIVQIAVE